MAFLLFAGRCGDALGGIADLVGVFPTAEAALAALDDQSLQDYLDLPNEDVWAHVVDAASLKPIFELNRDGYDDDWVNDGGIAPLLTEMRRKFQPLTSA